MPTTTDIISAINQLSQNVDKSIKPESSEEVVPEGGNIKLSCKYEGSIYNIQWFQQQQQRSRPEFLLLITEDGFISAEISGFSAYINKTDKRVECQEVSRELLHKLIPKLLGEENFGNKPVKIDCVHRIRGRAAAADAPPRQIIARIHHDPVQEHILRLSSQKFLSVKNVTSTGINCEELTPVKTEEFTSEHTSVSLSYKYHTTIAVGDYFFWYRQHPGKPPEFLIYISGSNFTKPADSLKKKRFFTQLSEDKHGVKLQINSAAVTDSAVYYCAVKPTVTGNTTTLYKNTTSTRGSINCEELTPVKTEEFTSEHTSVTLSYKYHKSADASDYFFWYRQHPGKPPEFLMSHSGTGTTPSAPVSGLSVTEVKAESA
ncbi:T-cell receptor alpha [Solea senegalensis]|nr:T-cell receptor alpha [Solea senegalensis]